MRKAFAVLGSAVFFVAAPGFVAGLAPWRIAKGGATNPPGWPLEALAIILIGAGIIALLDSFVRFAWQGLGTPAPVFPTSHLVVSGLCRYVRNPMYVAVVSTIFGQSLLLANTRVLVYGALVWLAFHVMVLGYEEPVLRARYADDYRDFCANVPRWIPRITPWKGGV
jgi:protein-S-isoprenylcysteine O-methyltransferase Ste14